MLVLRRNTSVNVTVGPVVSQADGVTPVTNLSIATATEAKIAKQNAGALVSIAGLTFTHIENGIYTLALTTNETNTAGNLVVLIENPATIRPIRMEFQVVPETVYDALYAGTATLATNASQIAGDATAASNMAAGADALVTGTVASGSTTSLINTNLTATDNNFYSGRVITFKTGLLAGQSAAISAYNGQTFQLTVTALTRAPSNGDTFVIS